MTQIMTRYAGQEKAKELSVNLWRQAPVQEAILIPGMAIRTFEDFNGFNLSAAVSSNVGLYAGRDGSWKSYEDTGVSFTNTLTGGALEYIGTTTDNLEAAVQLQCSPYVVASSAGLPLWFETIISKETIAATGGVGWVCGLNTLGGPANSFMADAGADIASTDFVGFASFDATGDKIDFIYKKTSGTLVTVKAGIASPVAATAIKVGFWYDGAKITPYINGLPTTDIITATAIAASSFPNGVKLSPTFGVKQAVNVAKYVRNYHIGVLQVQA